MSYMSAKEVEKQIDDRSVKYIKEKKLKPFVKWAGGKGQQKNRHLEKITSPLLAVTIFYAIL